MSDDTPKEDLARWLAFLQAAPTRVEVDCEKEVDRVLRGFLREPVPPRSSHSSAAPACAVVCIAIVATPLWLPAALLALGAYIYAIRRLWSRPMVVILRPFKEPGVDDVLVPMISMMQNFGRVVLLRNEQNISRGIGGLTPPRRGALLPIFGFLLLGVAWVLCTGHASKDLAWVLYLGVGANVLLNAWCDRRIRTGIAFFLAAAMTRWGGPIVARWVGLESWWSSFVVFAVAYAVVGALTFATPFVERHLLRQNLGRTLAIPAQIRRLAVEIVAPTVGRVYLKDAPRILDPIACADWTWRPTVRLLVSLANRTIIDLTSFATAPGVLWEVELCERLGVRPIYLCRGDVSQAALEVFEGRIKSRPTTLFTWSGDQQTLDDVGGFLEALASPASNWSTGVDKDAP